jgi:5'-deoxynucleotidase YfbR-like HD superfamily hydrolase
VNTVESRIRFIYDGGAVSRFHVVQTIRPDSDARHSFGVAWLIYLLTEGHASARLLMAGLAHDLAEQTVGDVPAPAKRALQVDKGLADLENKVLQEAGFFFETCELEHRTLKLADNLDGLMYCARELKMGNKFAKEVGERYWQYIQSMRPEPGPEMEVSSAVRNIFLEAAAA